MYKIMKLYRTAEDFKCFIFEKDTHIYSEKFKLSNELRSQDQFAKIA